MKIHASRATALALPLLLVAGACSGTESGSSDATVTDSAGVRIVTSSGSGSWTEEERWTLEEVFRVGGFEAEENARFGSVLAVDVDDAGRVYAADQQAREVRVFEADGSFVGVVGSPGEGPGEIGPMLMGVYERDGEVWTIDPMGQGIQRFDVEEGYLGSIPFNVMGGVPIRMDEVERGIFAQRRSVGMDPSEEASGDPVVMIGTETPDTLMVLEAGESLVMQGGMPQYSFFAPEPAWDVNEAGATARARSDRYSIEMRDPSGTLFTIVRREVAPQPVTEGLRREVLAAVRQQMEDVGAPPPMIEQILQQSGFAEEVPVLVQLLLEEDGTLWVQRTGDVADRADEPDFNIQDLGSPNWDVFDPEGVLLGQLTLPGRFQPLRMIDGVLWGIDRDELDTQSVVGMRVVR